MIYLKHAFLSEPWWQAYARVTALLAEREPSVQDAVSAHAELLASLVAAGVADLQSALATSLAGAQPPFDVVEAVKTGEASGALRLLAHDLAAVAEACRRDLVAEFVALGVSVPAGVELAPSLTDGPMARAVASLRGLLGGHDGAVMARSYARHLEEHGSGVASLHAALAWRSGALHGVKAPVTARLDDLHGLETQLARLRENTEALLAGAPAHDALLYGPRGSGKSTAVRALLTEYQARGLRLIELPLEALGELPAVLNAVADSPLRFVIFIDDLSFTDADGRYGPLKRVLDGGLALRPANAVVHATSNRRHLVKERLSDRPDPLDDDVHGWDTHNELLALSDRFGLVLTFPGAGQKRYLELVLALATRAGIPTGAALEEEAVRFAEWGNGYSGRTARQFVDSLLRPTSG